jgi:hypothetical protein
LRASVGDQKDHPRTQSRASLFVHQHGQELLELPLALWRDHPAFKQDGAQLIDQCVNRLQRLTPPFSDNSTSWRADRRSDPTPNDTM